LLIGEYVLGDSSCADPLSLDVREPTEVIQGSIPSSVNLPMSELQDALDLDGPLFQKKFSFDKPKKTQDIVFYCLAGVRAATAAREFQSRGYQRSVRLSACAACLMRACSVRNYKGSWQASRGRLLLGPRH
jgi:rhodanese-related sulfurtransferase